MSQWDIMASPRAIRASTSAGDADDGDTRLPFSPVWAGALPSGSGVAGRPTGTLATGRAGSASRAGGACAAPGRSAVSPPETRGVATKAVGEDGASASVRLGAAAGWPAYAASAAGEEPSAGPPPRTVWAPAAGSGAREEGTADGPASATTDGSPDPALGPGGAFVAGAAAESSGPGMVPKAGVGAVTAASATGAFSATAGRTNAVIGPGA